MGFFLKGTVKKAMIPKFEVERLWLAVLLQAYKDIVSLDAGKT